MSASQARCRAHPRGLPGAGGGVAAARGGGAGRAPPGGAPRRLPRAGTHPCCGADVGPPQSRALPSRGDAPQTRGWASGGSCIGGWCRRGGTADAGAPPGPAPSPAPGRRGVARGCRRRWRGSALRPGLCSPSRGSRAWLARPWPSSAAAPGFSVLAVFFLTGCYRLKHGAGCPCPPARSSLPAFEAARSPLRAGRTGPLRAGRAPAWGKEGAPLPVGPPSGSAGPAARAGPGPEARGSGEAGRRSSQRSRRRGTAAGRPGRAAGSRVRHTRRAEIF